MTTRGGSQFRPLGAAAPAPPLPQCWNVSQAANRHCTCFGNAACLTGQAPNHVVSIHRCYPLLAFLAMCVPDRGGPDTRAAPYLG
jgi:hypothetical protein